MYNPRWFLIILYYSISFYGKRWHQIIANVDDKWGASGRRVKPLIALAGRTSPDRDTEAILGPESCVTKKMHKSCVNSE